MSYGGIAARRKDAEEEQMVPTSSMFGFLERLPWKIGGRGRRYKPSAADLQDVGDTRTAALKARASGEDEPLITDESESGGEGAKKRQHGRKRSGTVASQETTNSLSSRGDLFPSEDEDDAVPLDDEFAMVLARKNTQGTLDSGGGESERKTRPGSTKTRSSRSSNMRTERRRGSGNGDGKEGEGVVVQVPSVADLEEEEERVREEEEAGIEREREAARKLAAERGLLNVDEADASVSLSLLPFRGGGRLLTDTDRSKSHQRTRRKPNRASRYILYLRTMSDRRRRRRRTHMMLCHGNHLPIPRPNLQRTNLD